MTDYTTTILPDEDQIDSGLDLKNRTIDKLDLCLESLTYNADDGSYDFMWQFKMDYYGTWLLLFIALFCNLSLVLVYKISPILRKRFQSKILVTMYINDTLVIVVLWYLMTERHSASLNILKTLENDADVEMEASPNITTNQTADSTNELQKHFACKFTKWFRLMLLSVSSMLRLLIAIERFCSIYFPMKYRVWFNNTQVRYQLLAIYVVGSVCNIWCLIVYEVAPDGKCKSSETITALIIDSSTDLLAIALVAVLVAILNGFSIFKICRSANIFRNSETSARHNDATFRKAGQTLQRFLIAISVSFIICSSFYIVLTTLQLTIAIDFNSIIVSAPSNDTQAAMRGILSGFTILCETINIAEFILKINYAYNMLIYILFGHQLRHEIKYTLYFILGQCFKSYRLSAESLHRAASLKATPSMISTSTPSAAEASGNFNNSIIRRIYDRPNSGAATPPPAVISEEEDLVGAHTNESGGLELKAANFDNHDHNSIEMIDQSIGSNQNIFQ